MSSPGTRPTESERDLVDRCRRGDEGAFEELVDRYKDVVFGLIARTVQDVSLAERLAQDVFLRLIRGLPYFRGEARLSVWVYRIVAHVCLEELSASPTANRQPESPPPGRPSRCRDVLEEALGRLTPQSRLLLAATYLEGARYEEFAEALKLPEATARAQLYSAKQQLRRLLETTREGTSDPR
jgi:RNA polymerase sigma factor (sigma-70 family)